MHKVLFLLNITFYSISCQSSDSSTENELQLNQTMQYSHAFIHGINQTSIADLEVYADYKPHYRPVLARAKSIEKLTNNVYNNIRLFDQQIAHLPLETAIQKDHFTTFQSLEQQAVRLQEESLWLIYKSWDNGGIQSTVFADTTKRKKSIQRIEATLSSIPLITQDRQLASSNNSILLTAISLLQQSVKQSEAVFINFFAGQVGGITICGPRAFVAINSSKTCLRLGETYEATLNIAQIVPRNDYKVVVEDSVLEKQAPYRTKHKIPATQEGEQSFSIFITLKDPLTQKQTFIRNPFYFEVTR